MLRGASRLLVVVALVAAVAVPAAQARARTTVQVETALAAAVLVQVNDVRRAHGLTPLTPSVRLAAAAAGHSREMVDRGPYAQRNWILHTQDMHALYERLGFRAPGFKLLERPGGGRPVDE